MISAILFVLITLYNFILVKTVRSSEGMDFRQLDMVCDQMKEYYDEEDWTYILVGYEIMGTFLYLLFCISVIKLKSVHDIL